MYLDREVECWLQCLGSNTQYLNNRPSSFVCDQDYYDISYSSPPWVGAKETNN